MKIIKNTYLICIATLKAKENKTDELLSVFSQLKKLSPAEPGCLRYELHQSEEDPSVFTFIDRFKDQAAFEFHCDQDYTKHFFDEVIPSLVDSMEISTHKEIELV